MNGFIAGHSYLVCSLAGTIVVTLLAWLTLARPQFVLTMLSGLIAVPAFVFCWFLEGDYWWPARVGGMRLGIEDAIVSFALSALAWYIVALVFGSRMHWRYLVRRSLARYLMAAAWPIAAFLLWAWLAPDAMTALLLAYASAGPVFLWLQRRLWPLVAAGAPLFGLAWFIYARACLWAFPDALQSWNLAGRWGVVVAGVPLGEIVWAICYGAYWPLFVGIVYEVTLQPWPGSPKAMRS